MTIEIAGLLAIVARLLLRLGIHGHGTITVPGNAATAWKTILYKCANGGRPYYRISRLGCNGGSSESDNGCAWLAEHDEEDYKMVDLVGRGTRNIGGEMLRCRWQRLQPRDDVSLKNDHALG